MLLNKVLIISRAYIGLILIILTFSPKFAFTQWKPNLSASQQVFAFANQLYGPDDLLVNGSLNIPDHPRAGGNLNFMKEEWTEGLIVIKGKSFKIDSNYPINLEVDGESLGYSPFTFEVIPASLRVGSITDQ